jgi:glutathione S-transferase
MITLHHLEYSQSFRVLWLLEELGIEYDLKKYDRDPDTLLAPAEYKSLSPTGAAPVITDGELVLAETNAILDYILDQYPDDSLRPPPGSPDRARHLFWFHAAQGSLMPIMLMDSIFRIIHDRVPFFLRPLVGAIMGKASDGFIRPRADALWDIAEEHLAEKEWFGGSDLTIADIALSYPVESADARGFLGEAYPHCSAWLQRIHDRPAFQSARKIDDRPSMVLPL